VDYLSELARAIRSELNPEALPDEPVDDLLRSYAVLALVVGPHVTPADVHDAWVAWMIPRDPDHPALVEFDKLDRAAADQDAPFVAAIRVVAIRRGLRRERGCR
jgi:hypothetical protein